MKENENRIKQYEELLKIEPADIFTEDMYVDELTKYFKRKRYYKKSDFKNAKVYKSELSIFRK